MRIAEGNVGGRNHARLRASLPHRDALVSEAASAHLAQGGEVDDETEKGLVMVGQVVKGPQLPGLGLLAVVRVEEGEPMLLGRKGGDHRGVHAPADANHGQRPYAFGHDEAQRDGSARRRRGRSETRTSRRAPKGKRYAVRAPSMKMKPDSIFESTTREWPAATNPAASR